MLRLDKSNVVKDKFLDALHNLFILVGNIPLPWGMLLQYRIEQRLLTSNFSSNYIRRYISQRWDKANKQQKKKKKHTYIYINK